MLDNTLRTGYITWYKIMISMVLELILFQKLRVNFGLSMDNLQEYSRWESASMVIQIMLDLTNKISQLCLTIQCTTLLRMYSEESRAWTILSLDTMEKEPSKIFHYLECSSTIMTMLDFWAHMMIELHLNQLLLSLWHQKVSHSSIMEVNNTTLVETILKIESLSGKPWTPTVMFTRW